VLLDPEAPPAAWARAIGGIFDAPPERRMAMSRAARRRGERFTWAAAARATLDVYREAAAARSNLP
jgi:glycosyltransferase involved in cell wall biosynthesis